MKYSINYTGRAESDILRLRKSGDKQVLVKLKKLLFEIEEHPTTGTGKPECLKGYATPTWSRRITDKHSLVYQIEDDQVLVLILAAYGHYLDK